jgi:hypothetical protein
VVAKIKNVSGQDLIVPALGGRIVLVGQVVDVDAVNVYAFTCQPGNWLATNKEGTDAHADGAAAETERVYLEKPYLRPDPAPDDKISTNAVKRVKPPVTVPPVPDTDPVTGGLGHGDPPVVPDLTDTTITPTEA